MFGKTNMSSKAQTGTTTYPADTRRKYLLVAAGALDITIAVGGGDVFTVPANGGWEPHITPTSQLVIVGACTVVTDTAHP